MKLIVGLGNVGPQYAGTRHNVGFEVVDRLAAQHGITLMQRHRSGGRVVARFGDGQLAGNPMRLLEPQTMMNGSGEALRAVPEWGVSPAEILIVCDDVNLPLGTLRLRPQGSAGGHHGLDDCLAALGNESVPRLRIGVAGARLPQDLTEYVLAPFAKAERPVAAQAVARAVDACAWWVADGIHAAMNRVNQRSTAAERKDE